MSTRTAARTGAAPNADRASGPSIGPVAAGAGYAVAELGIGLTVGGFFALGRAEALLFLALRPWLLALSAFLVVRWPLRSRIVFYVSALVLVGSAETILLLALGASDPLPEAVKGVAAGGLVAAVADVMVQAPERFLPRAGRLIGLAALLPLLLLTPALAPYEAIVLGRPKSAPAVAKPELMMMTALPIIWGEGGAFDPASRPAESYRLLGREFSLSPLDYLSEETLAGRLLLLAQPRALAPEELVALDKWVRRSGRILILADPALDWPSNLPLGDPRRAPATSLMTSLLNHWGIRLERAEGGGDTLDLRVSGMRLVTRTPGRVVAPRCQAGSGGLIAECRVGEGRALLVADADLLHDETWAPRGAARHQRTADNPLILAEWLDRLAGVERQRLDGRVEWIRPDARYGLAALLAFAPLLVVGAAAGLASRRRR